IIRGEGEALAIEALAEALSSDPEFYGFVRSLEAYEKSLFTDTTVILDRESELFNYLEYCSKYLNNSLSGSNITVVSVYNDFS
ncbi:MAG: hypothetical protein VX592_00075, partial [Chloroflexota bacterium]|nr:hypothetical protein [Chloroflexota bacterium]